MVTIATASDIHGFWNVLEYPKADLLLLAGDVLWNHAKNEELDALAQLEELEKLNKYYKDLKRKGVYREIIMVAGNHDWCFQLLPWKARGKLKDIIYLEDKALEWEGIKIYGSPWQPWFYDWAFNFPSPKSHPKKAIEAATSCWAQIPDDIQILITHSPPLSVLDETPQGINVGCPYLKDRIDQLSNLVCHVFGHIHIGYGKKQVGSTLFINTAICTEKYQPTNPIHLVSI